MISISIVSHGHRLLVNNLLSSIAEVEHGLELEIIITENMGGEVVLPESQHGLSLRILRNRSPQGFARNHNAAFREARGDFFCILNPDILFIEPVFRLLMQRIESGRADVIAPMMIDSSGIPQDSFRDLPTPFELVQRYLLRRRFLPPTFVGKEIIHPDWITGTFLLMRSETYERLGGLDERYFLYFEDVDFCSRARLAGLAPAVDTGLKMMHDARRESRRSLKYLAWHVASACRFFTSPVYRRVRRLTSN